MTKEPDDFEAVRTVVETLEPFEAEDRERIVRWAREKLGMPTDVRASQVTVQGGRETVKTTRESQTERATTEKSKAPKDIKSFVAHKAPSSDRQLAAAIAYYYAFEASADEKKDSIAKDDLIDACRKAGIRRLTNPGQTLRNAAQAGYLDRVDRGRYALNSVGENLVAMVLPQSSGKPKKAVKKKATKTRKKPAKKKATKKTKKKSR